jgi:tetratricopeptide (TPR) repeat protein
MNKFSKKEKKYDEKAMISLDSLLRWQAVSVVLAAFSVLLYGNTLWGGFVWDDRAAIIGNKDVRGESNIFSILFEHDFWGQDITLVDSHKSYRPLTTLSFRLNHFIHGYSASGYHLGNIIIFAITSVLVYKLATQWIASCYGPLTAALLFTFHPIHVEAVASLVGRADSLCGLFYIATLITYTESIRSKSTSILNNLLQFIPWMILSLMACLSKEIGITIYGILIIIELIEHISQVCKTNSASGSMLTKLLIMVLSLKSVSYMSILRIISSVTSLILFLIMRIRLNGEHKIKKWTMLENHIALLPSLKERILSYAQTNSWYFLKLIFPKYLCFDYGYACIPTIHDFFDIRNLLGFLMMISLLFLGYRSIQHSFRPSLLLGLCLLVIPLLPALNIFFPVGTTLAERLLFIPSIGFCFLIAELFTIDLNYVWHWQYRRSLQFINSNNRTVKLILLYLPATLFLVPIMTLCSIRIVTRNEDWNSEIRIYQSALSVCPHSVKALNNYAWLLMLQPNGQEKSLELTEKALHIHSSYAAATINNALLYSNRREYIRSIVLLQRAVGITTDNGKNLFYVGYGRFLFSESLSSNGYNSHVKFNLLHQVKRNYDDSIQHGFAEPAILHSRGSVSLALNEVDDAIFYLTAALNKSKAARGISNNELAKTDDIIPSHTFNQLGNAYKMARRYNEAAEAYTNALAIGGIDVSIGINLGDLNRQMGKYDSSREVFNGVIKVSNDAILPFSFYNNYGMLEYETGNYEAALQLFEKALRVHETVGTKPNEVSGAESHLQIILNNIKIAQLGIESRRKLIV